MSDYSNLWPDSAHSVLFPFFVTAKHPNLSVMTRLFSFFVFLTFFSVAIFIGLTELFPVISKPTVKSKLETKLEYDFLENPDPFFRNAVKSSGKFTIQIFSNSPEVRKVEDFFRKIEIDATKTQSLDLIVFDGETPNLIVLQFGLTDQKNNKIGEWAKSYLIEGKKKPR